MKLTCPVAYNFTCIVESSLVEDWQLLLGVPIFEDARIARWLSLHDRHLLALSGSLSKNPPKDKPTYKVFEDPSAQTVFEYLYSEFDPLTYLLRSPSISLSGSVLSLVDKKHPTYFNLYRAIWDARQDLIDPNVLIAWMRHNQALPRYGWADPLSERERANVLFFLLSACLHSGSTERRVIHVWHRGQDLKSPHVPDTLDLMSSFVRWGDLAPLPLKVIFECAQSLDNCYRTSSRLGRFLQKNG